MSVGRQCKGWRPRQQALAPTTGRTSMASANQRKVSGAGRAHTTDPPAASAGRFSAGRRWQGWRPRQPGPAAALKLHIAPLKLKGSEVAIESAAGNSMEASYRAVEASDLKPRLKARPRAVERFRLGGSGKAGAHDSQDQQRRSAGVFGSQAAARPWRTSARPEKIRKSPPAEGKNQVVDKDKTLAKFLPGPFRSEGARGAGRPEKPEAARK